MNIISYVFLLISMKLQSIFTNDIVSDKIEKEKACFSRFAFITYKAGHGENFPLTGLCLHAVLCI